MYSSALAAAGLVLTFLTGTTPLTQSARPQFEVATVKLSQPAGLGEPISINLGYFRNGRVMLGNVTLSDCIKFAYGLVSDAQIDGPGWIKTGEVRFDIVGQTVADTTQDQALLMLQTLLAERVKLAVHHEQRPLQFLALTVGKTGVKFGPAKPGGPVALRAGSIVHSSISMMTLATLLSRFERQLVLDMTELRGSYDLKLEWIPESLKNRAPADGSPIILNGEKIDPNGPSLNTALSEQLGLRLESRKGPVDVLVVDRAEKVPAEP